MNPWINYHHLYYFMAIAEAGTVSKAAERLRLGQPTLSAQLKQFEDTLGIKLFERHHKKLVLSEQGRIALDYARGIFKLGSEMYETLHDRLRPALLSVQLGALDSIPKQVMLQLTQEAYKVAPCSIRLIEGKLNDLLAELLAHRLDLLISNYLPSPEIARSIQHRLLVKRPVGFYGAPKFRSLRKNFPRSLESQPVVLPTHDSHLRYSLDQWFEKEKLKIEVIAETQDTALKKLMATSGMALIPAASHSVTRQVLAGELIQIGAVKQVHEELHLVASKRRIENPVASELMRRFKI